MSAAPVTAMSLPLSLGQAFPAPLAEVCPQPPPYPDLLHDVSFGEC